MIYHHQNIAKLLSYHCCILIVFLNLPEPVINPIKPYWSLVIPNNPLLSPCEKGKNQDGALELLEEMVHKLLAPNEVSWSAAIGAVGSDNCLERQLSGVSIAVRGL